MAVGGSGSGLYEHLYSGFLRIVIAIRDMIFNMLRAGVRLLHR